MSVPARARYVLVGGKLYREALLVEAMNQATTEYLERMVPQGATPRAMIRAVRGLKTPAAHRGVMNAALRALADSDLDVALSRGSGEDGEIVARFPTVLDKQVANA